jgi:gas vesicle protein
MTTADFGSHPASGSGSGDDSSSTSAKDRATQAAGTAADEGRHVAGVAQDEARKVASEATDQVQNLLSQATSQVEEQSRTQRDRLVETMRTFGDDLDNMASQNDGGMAADVAHDVADRVRRLTSHLDGREPRELLDDVRSFARRKPGTFLLGALVGGMVAGRLTRGAKAAHDAPSSGASEVTYQAPVVADVGGRTPPPPVAPGTATGEPLAGTGYPATPPVYPAGSELAGESGTRGGLS